VSKVFLHIGEPKTGTTFLQQVMWRNRAELSAQGIVLPGHHAQDHYRASQDLRGMQKKESDPAGSWTGEWDILAQQAQQAPAAAVISHELFSACDAGQAERAVRSLQPAEVHVVLTVRDMATLLPAEWQETVKHRNGKDWEGWLEDLIDRESSAPDRRQFWFWRVHDTLAIGALWAQFLPPERVHVIVNAPKGASGSLLWERWAALIGADPGSVDLSRARQNASLGMAEIEFLRRLNQELTPDVPDWFYMWNVKEAVAHRAFAGRPAGPRLVLPAERDGWAKEQAETLTTGLRESGFDIIGNVDDLRPQPAGPPFGPADVPEGQILDAAVAAAAALVANQYRKQFPPARPQGKASAAGGMAGWIESVVASSPRLKRAVRQASSRYPAVRRLRIVAWRALERTRKGS
jgi:hypothetical protein